MFYFPTKARASRALIQQLSLFSTGGSGFSNQKRKMNSMKPLFFPQRTVNAN